MKKRKTVLSVGDVLSIKLSNSEYAFARVIAKISLGDLIEVYTYFGNSPNDFKNIKDFKRLFYPQPIDSYTLYFKGHEGWDIVEKGNGLYETKDLNELRFCIGTKEDMRLIDVYGNEEKRSLVEMNEFPWYSPNEDFQIKRLIHFYKEKLQKEV